MKHIFALALTLASTSAFANGYSYDGGLYHGGDIAIEPTCATIDATAMSCAEVQNAVAESGAAIVYYGDDLFERVVSSGAYCSRVTGETTRPFSVMTGDVVSCWVGYTCETRGNN